MFRAERSSSGPVEAQSLLETSHEKRLGFHLFFYCSQLGQGFPWQRFVSALGKSYDNAHKIGQVCERIIKADHLSFLPTLMQRVIRSFQR